MTELIPAHIDEMKDWRFEIDFEMIAWAVFDRESLNSFKF